VIAGYEVSIVASVELTKDNFDEVINNNNFVIIDFWASWCGPCKNFSPIYEKVSEKYEDIVFAKINTEVEQELAGHFNIRSIPTLSIFREQVIIFTQPGMMPEEALEELIGKAKGLDMDQVRKDIEESQQSQGGS
jgi:thioredoxin 1